MRRPVVTFLMLSFFTSSAFAADITNLTVGQTVMFTGETSVIDVTSQRHSPRTRMATQYTEQEQFGEFFAFHKSWINLPEGTVATVVREGHCRYEGGRSAFETSANCAALIKIDDRYFALINKINSSTDYEQDKAVARVFPTVRLVSTPADKSNQDFAKSAGATLSDSETDASR